MLKINIAIDGYAATGKTTIAKLLAKKLNYQYLNSGKLYRAFTLHILKKAKELNIRHFELIKGENLDNILENLKITINENNQVCINGELIKESLSTKDIDFFVCFVSEVLKIRKFIKEIQQDIIKNKGIIMCGRDIGTKILPEAELKLFFVCDIDERIKRVRLEKSHLSSLDIRRLISQRDFKDKKRKNSPLIQAEDAVVIDSTNYTIDEIVDIVLNKVFQLLMNKELKTWKQ